ncbi:hypothetical protein EVAR_22901_1 [Eumeta japonica]|uniref:Uncharacterized protein n=1 Tax=Eumeta variegata TaxID=151549 RepID=A0A4C1UU52_EUMVA|nr:hypothetical protein EVAR_22901_1 [Eumeta japonica]
MTIKPKAKSSVTATFGTRPELQLLHDRSHQTLKYTKTKISERVGRSETKQENNSGNAIRAVSFQSVLIPFKSIDSSSDIRTTNARHTSNSRDGRRSRRRRGRGRDAPPDRINRSAGVARRGAQQRNNINKAAYDYFGVHEPAAAGQRPSLAHAGGAGGRRAPSRSRARRSLARAAVPLFKFIDSGHYFDRVHRYRNGGDDTWPIYGENIKSG